MKKNHSLINILFDPQTNGPLLMVINEKDKDFFEKDLIQENLYQKIQIQISNPESNESVILRSGVLTDLKRHFSSLLNSEAFHIYFSNLV